MRAKPKPPSQDQIDASAALAKLGVTYDVDSKTERVFEALVQLWKDKKQPPTITDLAAFTGYPAAAVKYRLSVLEAAKRVIKPQMGMLVPVT